MQKNVLHDLRVILVNPNTSIFLHPLQSASLHQNKKLCLPNFHRPSKISLRHICPQTNHRNFRKTKTCSRIILCRLPRHAHRTNSNCNGLVRREDVVAAVHNAFAIIFDFTHYLPSSVMQQNTTFWILFTLAFNDPERKIFKVDG